MSKWIIKKRVNVKMKWRVVPITYTFGLGYSSPEEAEAKAAEKRAEEPSAEIWVEEATA